MRTYAAIVLNLMELEEEIKKQMIPIRVNAVNINNGGYFKSNHDIQTYMLPQEVDVTMHGINRICIPSERNLLMTIADGMKKNNILWYCEPKLKKSSSVVIAIKGLLIKNILFKTDMTNFYCVNPIYMRRGLPLECVRTTMQAIHNNNGIDISLIRNLRAIDKFSFNNIEPIIDTQQIAYGCPTNDSSESEDSPI